MFTLRSQLRATMAVGCDGKVLFTFVYRERNCVLNVPIVTIAIGINLCGVPNNMHTSLSLSKVLVPHVSQLTLSDLSSYTTSGKATLPGNCVTLWIHNQLHFDHYTQA